MYIIRYDNAYVNVIYEEFHGDWSDMQDYLIILRQEGCYNISANYADD